MIVRGAPLIGATAAYGVALAMREDASDESLTAALALLGAARPTAVNLHWALARMQARLAPLAPSERAHAAYEEAAALCDEDVALCHAIGEHGHKLIRELAGSRPTGGRVQHPDPLQCRLARHGRLGDGAGADLSRP